MGAEATLNINKNLGRTNQWLIDNIELSLKK